MRNWKVTRPPCPWIYLIMTLWIQREVHLEATSPEKGSTSYSIRSSLCPLSHMVGERQQKTQIRPVLLVWFRFSAGVWHGGIMASVRSRSLEERPRKALACPWLIKVKISISYLIEHKRMRCLPSLLGISGKATLEHKGVIPYILPVYSR